MTATTLDQTPILKLSKDLKAAAVTLSDDEARFLVDSYYQMQANRIRADNQVRSLAKEEAPHEILSWFAAQDGLRTKSRRH